MASSVLTVRPDVPWRSGASQQENAAPAVNGRTDAPAEVVPGEQVFSEVIRTLPELYPESRLKELSVPFCFICLLHLANEKNLSIAGSKNLDDLFVRQNGPPPVGVGFE